MHVVVDAALDITARVELLPGDFRVDRCWRNGGYTCAERCKAEYPNQCGSTSSSVIPMCRASSTIFIKYCSYYYNYCSSSDHYLLNFLNVNHFFFAFCKYEITRFCLIKNFEN